MCFKQRAKELKRELNQLKQQQWEEIREKEAEYKQIKEKANYQALLEQLTLLVEHSQRRELSDFEKTNAVTNTANKILLVLNGKH